MILGKCFWAHGVRAECCCAELVFLEDAVRLVACKEKHSPFIVLNSTHAKASAREGTGRLEAKGLKPV